MKSVSDQPDSISGIMNEVLLKAQRQKSQIELQKAD
jgi:hypothetical protein